MDNIGRIRILILSVVLLSVAACDQDNKIVPLEDCVGHYRVTEKYTISITTRNGYLYYCPTGQSFGDRFLQEPPGLFYLEEWQGNKIRFQANRDGWVEALVIVKESGERLCPRVEAPVTIPVEPVAKDFTPMLSEDRESPRDDSVRVTLQSVRKTGNFYTLHYYADYSGIVEKADSWHYWVEHKAELPGGGGVLCSVFYQGKETLLGRNFDNMPCDVLVGFYRPKEGYASIALTRLSDLGFKTGTDITALPLKDRFPLLAAPFLVADGMNEKGLALGIASVKRQKVTLDREKQNLHISAFCRLLLDRAGSVADVPDLLQRYNIYDAKEDGYTVAHHLLVADARGNSAILECVKGRFDIQVSKRNWEAVTNSPLSGIPEAVRRNQCPRYEALSDALKNTGEDQDWRWAMERLREVAITGNPGITCWSSVYDLKEKSLYLAINFGYGQIFKLSL